jgi:hypothetical protein
LGWAEWDVWGQEWEALKDVSIAHSYTRICPSWVVLSRPNRHCSYFDSDI